MKHSRTIILALSLAIAAAASVFISLSLPRVYRWATDPVYGGKVRLACSSIEGTLLLHGKRDPAKLSYVTERGVSSFSVPGAKPGYASSVRVMPVVLLKDGRAFNPAFAITQSRWTGFMGSLEGYRVICPVGLLGYQYEELEGPALFADHPDIVFHAFLLADSEDKEAVWRVYEFELNSDRRHVEIPAVTELPTVGQHPRGLLYWEAYVAAAEEQGSDHWSADSRERRLRERRRLN